MFFLELFYLFVCFATGVMATTNIDNSTATTVNFTNVNVSLMGQTTTAVVGNNSSDTTGVSVTNDDGAGWTATMTATNLTTKGAVKKMAGNNSTVNFTGVYDGVLGVLPNGSFMVEITTGGSVGVAKFKWIDPAGNVTNDIDTNSSVFLSNGISVTFSEATYMVGDKWSIGVDVFPYTGLTVKPSVIYVGIGDSNVSSGSEELLTGLGVNSNPKTMMTATSGNGIGTYWQDLDLILEVHANSLSGSFGGVILLTVS